MLGSVNALRPGRSPGDEKKMTAVQFLTWVIVGVCVALVGVNLVHVFSCPSNNPDAIEAHYDALQYRLVESEKHVRWQTSALNRIVNHLQSQLTALERSELDALLLKSEEEAVQLALRLLEHPAPAIPWDVQALKYKSGGDTNSWSSYFTDDIYEYNGNSTTDDYDDDWLTDYKKANGSSKTFTGQDKFGGGGAVRDDDDFFMKGGKQGQQKKGGKDKEEIGHLDDEYDDPAESFQEGGQDSQGGGIFRDNLSDADARHLCEGWQTEYGVKIGVEWGSLPYDLQQKWLQYSCDYLLKA